MAQTTKTTLPEDIFAVEVPNHELLKRAYGSYLANVRSGAPGTKTRGLVSGGGKKPWRQKGTGRARVGSTRSPIWRGGGITFGPTGNENHRIKISKTSKHVALRQALTLAAKENRIHILDIETTGKTKDVASFVNKQSFSGNVLLVVDEKTPELIRSTNNLKNIELVRSLYLSVYKILNADVIVITPAALSQVRTWLSARQTESEEA